jgi:phage terminase large subunit
MQINFTEHFQALFRPKRYKVYFGGRGGMKTASFSKALLFYARQRPLRVLCLREFQGSIKESVHSSLSREVNELNMSDFFTVQETSIKGRNGSLFIYAGIARNPEAIKSYDDFDICWIEEAEAISERSLRIVKPTIRKEGSEIWISFNPENEFGAVYSEFVKPYIDKIRSQGFYEDSALYVTRVNLPDNPFASEVLRKESAKMKAENYKEWLHVYGGECDMNYKHSIIQPEWFEAAIDAHIKLGFKAEGVRSMGFDLADTGDDKAITIRHGSVVTHTKRWSHGELPEAIDIAFEEAGAANADFMVYDDDGLGKSMKVYLAKSLTKSTAFKHLKVIPYNGNARIDDPDDYYETPIPGQKAIYNRDKFKNRRAQKYWELRDRFEATYNALEKHIYTDPDKLISICSDCEDLDVLKSEIVKIKRLRGNNTQIQIQSKKDAIKENIKSPNMADSLKMSFANPVPFINSPLKSLEFQSEF